MTTELIILRQESTQFDRSLTSLKDTCSTIAMKLAQAKQELEQAQAELRIRGERLHEIA